MKILYLDTETTGLIPGKDRFIQLAYKNDDTGDAVNELFNPGFDIGFESMAVHHITNEDVKGKPDFKDSEEKSKLEKLIEDHVVVAHNASFDVGFLGVEGIEPKYVIDTYKLAYKYLEEDVNGKELQSHSLQYLRYALGLNEVGVTAHDALGDVIILENLFKKIFEKVREELKLGESKKEITLVLAFMIKVSSEPMLLRKIRFGKHRGKLFEQLATEEKDYLVWLSNQSELDDDLRFTLDHYLT